MSAAATPATAAPLLALDGLTVRTTAGETIVEGVDLALAPGEVLGLVGESGCGKTTTARALLGFQLPGAEITAGTLRIAGRDVPMDDSMRALRGRLLSYVPQDPGRSLNPSLRIGASVEDVLGAHGDATVERAPVGRILESVGLPGSADFARRFPHQLSGGQQQRVCIGMALSCGPEIVVLDEPTTGLDVITQALIVEELQRLRDEQGVAMVYVTHDLSVVAQIADRVAVMYGGRIVEQGPTADVLTRPAHPYTRGLLSSIPDYRSPHRLDPMPGVAVGVGERPAGCAFAPRCPQRSERCEAEQPPLEPARAQHARCFHWGETPAVERVALSRQPARVDAVPVLAVDELSAEHRGRGEIVRVAEHVSFSVEQGACVALVGESGSGKTTIARAIAGLHPLAGGRMTLLGAELPSLARRRSVAQRRRIQMVFQSSAEALNPRHDVRAAVGRPAQLLRGMKGSLLDAEVDRLLEKVRLPARLARRYPGELSGGERQRVAIARALAAGPELLLCDEITSALDVSVQAAVLELLGELRRELGLSLLFITHDLGVVATIADRVLVLERGAIVEAGETAAVLSQPEHPYTRRLLDAAPSVSAVA